MLYRKTPGEFHATSPYAPRVATRKYDLLAIDLDGTLFDRKGRVSDANRTALRTAREQGLRTTICTGRGLVECVHALEWINQRDPVVVAGGSIVACPVSRRTRHRFAVDLDLVQHSVATLLSHRHAALVLKDPLEAGYDYLVVRGVNDIPLDPVTLWWFQAMNVRVRYARTLDEDPHPEHTVRVGACGKASACAHIMNDLRKAAGDRATIHHFPAVVAPEDASRTDDGDTLHVLELFDANARKWSGIEVVAKDLGIHPNRIAAIGDQINDLDMIEHAALGIAMGNAIPAVRERADRSTTSNDDDGVAFAIGKILAGEW